MINEMKKNASFYSIPWFPPSPPPPLFCPYLSSSSLPSSSFIFLCLSQSLSLSLPVYVAIILYSLRIVKEMKQRMVSSTLVGHSLSSSPRKDRCGCKHWWSHLRESPSDLLSHSTPTKARLLSLTLQTILSGHGSCGTGR